MLYLFWIAQVNGLYDETTQNPDILFEFNLKNEIRLFSVECKWRKKLNNNGVEFAYESQLARNRKYETEKNIPVYIAIGIGGEASNPEHLFLIPLKNGSVGATPIWFEHFQIWANDFKCSMRRNDSDGNVFTTGSMQVKKMIDFTLIRLSLQKSNAIEYQP